MRLSIVEHKTTSEDVSEGSDYWKRLRLDAQVSIYFRGARALGHDVVECLYDVVRKPALRPSAVPLVDADGVKIVHDGAGARVRTKDGKKWRETSDAAQGYALQTRPETPDEYRARLRADIAEQPEKYFTRGIVVRLEEEERDAAYDAWHLGRAIREAELANRWPRNPDACVRYGRTCDFFAVCAKEASLEDPTRYRRLDAAHPELDAEADDGKVRLPLVTTTSLSTYRRCAREYQLAYVRGFRSVESAAALRFGRLWHKALEHWWTTVDLETSLAVIRAGEREVDEWDAIKAEELLRGYHFRWKDEPLDVLAVEAQFRTPLVNPATGAASKTFELGGRIDAVVRAAARADAAE